jgi:hypothetical protein
VNNVLQKTLFEEELGSLFAPSSSAAIGLGFGKGVDNLALCYFEGFLEN